MTTRDKLFRVIMQFKDQHEDGMDVTYVLAATPYQAVVFSKKTHRNDYGGMLTASAEEVIRGGSRGGEDFAG